MHKTGLPFLALTAGFISACAPSSPGTPSPVSGGQRAAMLGAPIPGVSTPLPPRDSVWIERTLSSLTLRQKIAQLIMPWVGGEYAPVGSPEFEQVRKWVEEDEVGSLVLSIGEPLSYAAKLNEMQSRARIPLLIASDMENGPGFRLCCIYALPSLLSQGGGTAFPPVMALGATRSEQLAYQLGEVTGREARAIGVHLAFGPVLDVNANPLNPVINTRSMGEDPVLVSRLATALIRGARSTGLMTTGKHFPGHGDTDTDSHIGLPTIRASRAHLDSVDFPPFRAAIAADVDAIMTAHIAEVGVEGADAPPATLSRKFMSSVLRDEMGFHGLLFTDAMTMGGIAKRYGATEPLILALEAGTDILLMPRDVTAAIETVLGAVNSGRLTEKRIDESVRRVLAFKARAGLIDGRMVDISAVDRIVNVPANQKVADEVAERSITLGLDRQSLVPIVGGPKKILSITYAEASDLIAGSAFNAAMRARYPGLEAVRVDGRTTQAEYATLRARADSADLVLVSAYVSPEAYKGTVSADVSFSGVIDSVAKGNKPVVLISFGSPYLVTAFPSVSTYLFAWGGAPISQRAAARALTGERAITGKLPVSIPPVLKFGDGIMREALPSAAKQTPTGSGQ